MPSRFGAGAGGFIFTPASGFNCHRPPTQERSNQFQPVSVLSEFVHVFMVRFQAPWMRWAGTTLTSHSPASAGEGPGHAGPAQSPRRNVFPRRLTVRNARGRLTVVRNGAYADLETSGIDVLVSKRSALARNGRRGGNARQLPGRRKFSVLRTLNTV